MEADVSFDVSVVITRFIPLKKLTAFQNIIITSQLVLNERYARELDTRVPSSCHNEREFNVCKEEHFVLR